MHAFRHGLLISLNVLVLLTAGCASDVKPTNVIVDDRENLKTKPNQVRNVDPSAKVVSLVDQIQIQDIRTSTLNGRMQITIVLKNNRGRRDVINMRMRWLDSAGVLAAQYDPWQTIALEGFEEKAITLNSPTPRAEDFRIEMQTNE